MKGFVKNMFAAAASKNTEKVSTDKEAATTAPAAVDASKKNEEAPVEEKTHHWSSVDLNAQGASTVETNGNA